MSGENATPRSREDFVQGFLDHLTVPFIKPVGGWPSSLDLIKPGCPTSRGFRAVGIYLSVENEISLDFGFAGKLFQLPSVRKTLEALCGLHAAPSAGECRTKSLS
jgi:hypothetical protein